ncbi:MAG: amino acid permease [Sporolactobacillus sp.]
MKERSLKRSINGFQGIALTISAVLGCGILVLPSLTADTAGPASLLSWALMSVLAFPIVLTLANLAIRIPNAGGITAYVADAFGAHTSYLLSWIMLGSVPIGAPTLALTGAIYCSNLLHLNHWAITGLAAGLLCVSLILNSCGIKLSSRVSVVTVIIIIGLIVIALATQLRQVTPAAFHPFLTHGWLSVGSTTVLIFFSFVGWEMVTPLAEEFKNPKRDMMLSLLVGVCCISVLYLLLAFVTVGTHAYGGARTASLSLLLSSNFGPFGTAVVAVLAVFITFSAVHANIAGFSRMVYAEARAGYFPAYFSVLHKKMQTPMHVLSMLGGVFFSLLFLYGMFHPSLGLLIKATSTVFIVSYVLTMLAALKLLRKPAHIRVSAWIACLTTLFIFLFSGWLIIYPLFLAVTGEVFHHFRAERAGQESATQVGDSERIKEWD